MTRTISVEKKTDGSIPFLTEIIGEIPTNTILHKRITGIGATYSELKAQRNSIIIEPNRPVIIGKCKEKEHKEDNLFGVYCGIYTDDIVAYIERSGQKYLKIMTTPESLLKVIKAVETVDMNIYTDFFLMFDECHKIIKDVDYRDSITLPMDLFFECKNKALISATPIEFTDKRFKKFDQLILEPKFEFEKNIDIKQTNNVLEEMKRTLANQDGCFFIFCNCTDMIYAFMKQLDLFEESAVFCSDKSVEKLKRDKNPSFTSAYQDWDVSKSKKYNWFTCRFYNAVDIKLDYQPNVIILTDCHQSEYTLMDPYSDTIQAIGRFRKGVAHITHILNTNKDFISRTRQEVAEYINALEKVQLTLKTLHDNERNMAIRQAFQSVMDSSTFNNFLTPNKEKDYFKIDNYIDEMVVQGYYNNAENILEAYRKCNCFHIIYSNYYYKHGDFERLKMERAKSVKDKQKIIVQQLEELGECITDAACDYKAELRNADSFIVEAFDILGKEEIEKLGYRRKAIKEAMIMKAYKDQSTSTTIIKLIKNSFREGEWYSDKFIKEEITRIFKLQKVNPHKAITSHTIEDYFDVVQKNKLKKRGKYLTRCKF